MRHLLLCTILALAARATAAVMPDTNTEPLPARVELYGPMGERFDANMRNWLVTAPYANPGMTQMYFRRNQEHQIIVKWYGEFSGKYITSAALNYAMNPDPSLKDAIDYVVGQLALAQDSDGYLGVWPDSMKFAGMAPGGLGKTWDVWSHYHNMLGLYYWHKISNSQQAGQTLFKAAQCLYDYFIVHNHQLDEDKDGTDAAIGHIFALLYEDTRTPRYLEMAERVLQTFVSPSGGGYFNAGLQGVPFYQMKRKRWECLHAIQTIAALYRITGDRQYLTSFANIWRSIRDYDRHNTGGFSSGEAACGNPYDTRAIETCCTIAWMALCIDMLNLSHDPTVADELELSTWNALLGAQHPSGRTFTYNTPMLGDRKASAHDIVFQALAGSSELNCCSVNGPRGFGMIRQWGWQQSNDTITINYYGPSKAHLTTQDGKPLTITQSGDYPFGPGITITITAPRRYQGVLRLRIPAWSDVTAVAINGRSVNKVTAGHYLILPLRNKDAITINFDMRPRYWTGERNLSGTTSVYIGPILLACDQRFSNNQPIDPATLTYTPCDMPDKSQPKPYILLRAIDKGGHSVILCDFASAGQAGTTYTTWLPCAEID